MSPTAPGLRQFLTDETGAVAVDWVTLTAAVVGLGLSGAAAVRMGTTQVSTQLETSLSSASLPSLRWLSARQIVNQTFGSGNTAGWSRGQTTAFGVWGMALGPFANDTQNTPLTYGVALSPGARNALIEFDLIVGDSWDGAAGPNNPWTRPEGDVLRFQIDGQTISTEAFVQGQSHVGFRPGMFSERSTSVEIGGATYNLRLVPTNLPTANIGGSGSPDQRWRVQLEALNAPQNFQLGYSAVTSQGAANESFGIANFSVHEN